MENKSPATIIVSIVVVAVLAIGGWLLWDSMQNDDAQTDTSSQMETEQPAEEAEPSMNIVETASANEDFSTLVAAIEAADLAEALSADGPFTVFAPTNAAFDKLPEGTLDDLLDNPDQLAEILTYHVVSGEVPASSVVTLEGATTLNGADVEIRVEGDTVFVNDARVVTTDIRTSNGIIHVIDTVLLPPTEE